jgi:uncharacterized repeat protein (TIGR03803 family)
MNAKVSASKIGLLVVIAIAAGSASLAAQNNPAYWHVTTLYAFTGNADGAQPFGGVVLDPAGNVYGTTTYGGNFGGANCGTAGCGVAFKVDTSGHESLLHSFTGPPDGANPYFGLARASAGALYGQTTWGGSFAGIVFQLRPSAKACVTVLCPWNESTVYDFGNGYGQVAPAGLPILDSEGNIYSTTSSGGDPSCNGGAGCGTAFKVNPQGQVTILHDFQGGSDGYWPMGPMLLMPDGSLYGTTVSGGSGAGTVYKIDTNGIESIVYSFTGGTDGGGPETGVIADEQGNLYGTAQVGGQHSSFCYSGGCGVVFKLTPNQNGGWTETSFYSFQGGADGENPLGGLLRDSQGNLYGTTPSGGDCQYGPYCGTVYKLDSAANKTTLWNFQCGTDGCVPQYGSLVMDQQGSLYGTTSSGGDLSATNPNCLVYGFGCGVVFKLTP